MEINKLINTETSQNKKDDDEGNVVDDEKDDMSTNRGIYVYNIKADGQATAAFDVTARNFNSVCYELSPATSPIFDGNYCSNSKHT